MEKEKKRAIAALVFRLVALTVGVAGICYHMLINTVVDSGFMVRHNWAYFTLQTNLFSCIIFAVLIWRGVKELRRGRVSHIHPSVHLACTAYITMTLLGFWGLLAPLTGMPDNAYIFWDNLFVHTMTPLFAVADYVLFAQHGSLRKREAVRWLLYPAVYLVSVMVLAQVFTEPYYSFTMQGREIHLMYPYPFLDPQVMGAGGVVGVIAALCVVFCLAGVLLIWVDGKLAKR